MKEESEFIPEWDCLVQKLRKELEEYGGLLATMQDLQNCILGRDSEGIMEVNAAVEKQMLYTTELRNDREATVVRLLEEWGVAREFSTLAEVIPLFPEAAQGLLFALSEEINRVVDKARQRARQNQLLLARANDVIEQIIRTVKPQSVKTYNRRGAAAFKVGVSEGTCMKTVV